MPITVYVIHPNGKGHLMRVPYDSPPPSWEVAESPKFNFDVRISDQNRDYQETTVEYKTHWIPYVGYQWIGKEKTYAYLYQQQESE